MVDSRENESGNVPSDTPDIHVHVFGRTDVGMVRDHNEDNFLIADLSTKNRSIQPAVQKHRIGEFGSVFAVCDGMGGAAAGEVASQIAVDTIYEIMQAETPPANEEDFARRLNMAICEAGRRIHTESKANSARRGMGTTATVAVLMGERILFGQVGDSRAHIVRNGVLVQTTKDQSLVQQLIDANQLTIEEAKNFDRSNIILQALGTSEEVHVDVTSILLRKGDILVICSDGLSGMVEPEDIRDVVLSIENPIESCQKLTQMACDNGGDDNVTVIVAKFDGESLAAPKEEDVVCYNKYILSSSSGDSNPTINVKGVTTPPPLPGTLNAAQNVSPKTVKKIPVLLLAVVLAIIGLVIGFSMKEDEAPPISEDVEFVPPVAVTPADSSGEAADVASSDDMGRDAHGNTATPPLVDNAKLAVDPAPENVATEQPGTGEQDPPSDDSDVDTDVVESERVGADGVVLAGKVDSETDSSIANRSVEVDSASTLEKVSGDANGTGKWTRTKLDRKRVSAEEPVSTDDEDGNDAPIIEDNPY